MSNLAPATSTALDTQKHRGEHHAHRLATIHIVDWRDDIVYRRW